MFRATRWCVLALLAIPATLFASTPGAAAPPEGLPRAAGGASGPVERSAAGDTVEVVLLGTSHFAGSMLDESTSEIGDVLTEGRQEELEAIAGRFADFGPDRVFLECDRSSQARFDSLYRAYVSGEHDPTALEIRNERQQLGFRIADRSGSEGGVTCADAFGLWLYDRAVAVAREHDSAWLDSLQSYERRSDAAYLADHTIGEYLGWLNTDELLYENYQVYNRYLIRFGSFEGDDRELHWEGELNGREYVFVGDLGGFPVDWVSGVLESVGGRVADSISGSTDVVVRGADVSRDVLERARSVDAETLDVEELGRRFAEEVDVFVGFPDHYLGADLVAEWYKRNLRIYANLLHYTEPGEDRIVALIGQAHVWPLREMLRANPRFQVVPLDEVL